MSRSGATLFQRSPEKSAKALDLLWTLARRGAKNGERPELGNQFRASVLVGEEVQRGTCFLTCVIGDVPGEGRKRFGANGCVAAI